MRLQVSLREEDRIFSPTLSESGCKVPVSFQSVQYVPIGTSDYSTLKNKPSINEHELGSGENSLANLGLGLSSNSAIDKLFK